MAKKNYSEMGLQLLIAIVNRPKIDFYIDLIQGFESNLQMVVLSEGTANPEMFSKLDLTNSEKGIIIGVIRDDRATDVLRMLDMKFRTVRNGDGIAFTVSLSSVIGASLFGFLSNTVLDAKEEKKDER